MEKSIVVGTKEAQLWQQPNTSDRSSTVKAAVQFWQLVTIWEWFPTTVGVRQECILLPCLCSISLEQITIDVLDGFEGIVKIGGRTATNLRCAVDIDLLVGSWREVANWTERLDSTAKKYRMEISGEKRKIMVMLKGRDANGESRQIQIDGCTLEEVSAFSTSVALWLKMLRQRQRSRKD